MENEVLDDISEKSFLEKRCEHAGMRNKMEQSCGFLCHRIFLELIKLLRILWIRYRILLLPDLPYEVPEPVCRYYG